MDLSKSVVRFFLVAILLASLIGVAIHEQLVADASQAKWQSFLIRLGLALSIGCILAWRLYGVDLFSRARDLRRALFCLFFLFVLFTPLLSQFSFLGKSVRQVATFLYRQKQGGMEERIIHLVTNFSGTYQLYIRQNFITPHWYVQLNALVKVHLLGISPNNNITKGKNGFYFEGMGSSRVEKDIVENFDNISDYMGQIPFTEEELRQWKVALEQRSYWLKSRGSDYVFVLAPTKAFVYPEYLPSSIQRLRGKARYEQLSAYLRDYADIHFIDLLPPLLAAKQEKAYPLLFYKTDFHWNFYGAFIAYQTIMREMKGMLPHYEVNVPTLDDFEIKINPNWAHQRFMFMLGLPLTLHSNEHHITMMPRPGGLYDGAQDIPAEGIYDIYPPLRPITAADGKSMDMRLLRNPRAPVPSIVLLGDSFLEKCMYFFSANAQRVLNYRTVVNFPAEIFHYEQPSIVIQEILNMFILRPAPNNPRRVGEHYYETKFVRNADRVLFKLEQETFIPDHGKVEGLVGTVDFVDLPRPQRGEIRVAAIEIQAEQISRLMFQFMAENGSKIKESPYRADPGMSRFYLELPPASVKLEVRTEDGKVAPVTIRAVEVRTDCDS